jgi:hypothetical protein
MEMDMYRTIDGAAAALALLTVTGLFGRGAVRAYRIDVPGWGASGRLTADRAQIRWSNGFVWRRHPAGAESKGGK